MVHGPVILELNDIGTVGSRHAINSCYLLAVFISNEEQATALGFNPPQMIIRTVVLELLQLRAVSR